MGIIRDVIRERALIVIPFPAGWISVRIDLIRWADGIPMTRAQGIQ